MRTWNAWSLKENYIYAPWTHRASLTRWLWLECCARCLTRNWTCCNGPNDRTTTADIGSICWPWHQMSRTWRRYGATDWKTSTQRGDWHTLSTHWVSSDPPKIPNSDCTPKNPLFKNKLAFRKLPEKIRKSWAKDQDGLRNNDVSEKENWHVLLFF